MDYINKFIESDWLHKASDYIKSPNKIKELLSQLMSYIEKDGLASVKCQLVLLYDYVYDFISGKYNEGDNSKLLLIIGALIYVVSPIDIIPDFLPGGLLDDAAIISWAIKETALELEKYNIWRNSK